MRIVFLPMVACYSIEHQAELIGAKTHSNMPANAGKKETAGKQGLKRSKNVVFTFLERIDECKQNLDNKT